MPDDCVICAKHRGEGPLGGVRIWEDEQVVVFHAPTGFLGHLFVETKRHAPCYPGTPADVRWHESDEWDGAPHGDEAATAELATRLRPYFE